MSAARLSLIPRIDWSGLRAGSRTDAVRCLLTFSTNNGYRFAKCEGESFVTSVEKCLKIVGFCDSARRAGQATFIFDSSRCLNSDSNFTGHMIATSRQTANAYSAGAETASAEYAVLKTTAANRIWTGAAFAAAKIKSRVQRRGLGRTKMFQGMIDTSAAMAIEATANGDALFDLGVLYSSGRSGLIDLVAAHKWFNLAALKGRVDAISLRQEIAGQMSGAEIAIAQREARAWMATH